MTEGAGVEVRVRLEPWVPAEGAGVGRTATGTPTSTPTRRTTTRCWRPSGGSAGPRASTSSPCARGGRATATTTGERATPRFSDEHFLVPLRRGDAQVPDRAHVLVRARVDPGLLRREHGPDLRGRVLPGGPEPRVVLRDPALPRRFPTPRSFPASGQAEDAVALVPHPTSWWWQERDGVEKYTTNVASHLAFGLLSGELWDGLVVMGYDHDHYFYQNLWFHVLNEGYRMTPVAELDGGLEPGTRFYYGAMRTYAHVGARDEHGRAWWSAVRAGPHVRELRAGRAGPPRRPLRGRATSSPPTAPPARCASRPLPPGTGRTTSPTSSSSATAASTASGTCERSGRGSSRRR